MGLLTVVSCTGYATPGLDIMLARDLGMSDAVQRLHIGHMGCYAALPGLGATADFVTAFAGIDGIFRFRGGVAERAERASGWRRSGSWPQGTPRFRPASWSAAC